MLGARPMRSKETVGEDEAERGRPPPVDTPLSAMPPLAAVAADSELVRAASSSSSEPFVRSLPFKLTCWTSAMRSMLATRSTRAIVASSPASTLALSASARSSRIALRRAAAPASKPADGRGRKAGGGGGSDDGSGGVSAGPTPVGIAGAAPTPDELRG
eukprot:scaffold13606_cov118-Isochrysis_galbana.AAC.2